MLRELVIPLLANQDLTPMLCSLAIFVIIQDGPQGNEGVVTISYRKCGKFDSLIGYEL